MVPSILLMSKPYNTWHIESGRRVCGVPFTRRLTVENRYLLILR